MKKLGLLIMPIMAISFLVGCSSNPTVYNFDFAGTNCSANNEKSYKKDTEVNFTITPDDGCLLPPSLSKAAVTGIDEYKYEKDDTLGTATFSCTMTANVTIRVMASLDPAKTLNVTKTDGKSLPSSIEAFESFGIIAHNKNGELVNAKFTSSDESIISITEESNGITVKGENGGSAIITCKASGYATYSRKIEVIPLIMEIKQDDAQASDLPTSIYQEDTLNLAAYEKKTSIKLTNAEFSTEDTTITITEQDSKVVLTGVSEGVGKIVCKAKGYRDTEAYVYVNSLKTMVIKLANGDPMPSAIELSTPTKIVAYDEGIHIIETGVTFTSSDTSIIEIGSSTNEVTITGKKLGIATITAEAYGYRDATCEVEVKQTYDVTCTSSDVTLSNQEASTDKDYTTTITVNKEKISQGYGYSVPNELSGITVGGSPLTDYTYTPNESNFSAELTIPKDKINGNVNIDLAIAELTPLCFTTNKDNNSLDINIDLGWEQEIIDVKKLQYKINNGEWTQWPVDDDDEYNPRAVDLPKAGDKLYVKNTTGALSTSSSNFLSFFPDDDFMISGNINSMVNYQPLTDYCFFRLFEGFANNINIIGAPALPADTLAPHCYDSLFPYCSGLKTAPALPATQLAERCYYDMFNGCSGLTEAPELPATELKDHCYAAMFQKCSGLTEAPELPATTLQRHCYQFMFQECTSLTSVPTLPATTLAEYCYADMFNGCSKLNYVKVKFGKDGWPTAKGATDNWLNGVAKKGTFGWKGDFYPPRGASNVPDDWSVVIIG